MRQSEREHAISEIRELVPSLADVPDAVERLQAWAGRGYPTGGDGSRGSRGGSPVESALRLQVDDGRDVNGTDPFAAELARLDRALSAMVDAVRTVRNSVLWSRPAPAPVNGRELWCRNHLRVGMSEPVHGHGVCAWCCDVLRHFGQLPTPRLMDMRARGRRITMQMFAAEGLTPVEQQPGEEQAS